jgi:hypothetical protein
MQSSDNWEQQQQIKITFTNKLEEDKLHGMPVSTAVWSKAKAYLDRLDAEIVGSNPA